jgi:hypothetical protein
VRAGVSLSTLPGDTTALLRFRAVPASFFSWRRRGTLLLYTFPISKPPAAPPHLLFCLTTAGTYPRLCRGGGLANHRRTHAPPRGVVGSGAGKCQTHHHLCAPPVGDMAAPRVHVAAPGGGALDLLLAAGYRRGATATTTTATRHGTARHSRSISIPREIHRRGPPRPSELEMASSSFVSSAERRQRDGKLKQSKLLVLLLPPAHGPPPPPRATTSRASCNAGGTVQHSSRGGG